MPSATLRGLWLTAILAVPVLGVLQRSPLPAQPSAPSADRGILMIDVGDAHRPAFALYIEAFLKGVKADASLRPILYREHQDLRLARDTTAFVTQAVDYWATRYADVPIAVLVANNLVELELATQLRARLGRTIPIVYVGSVTVTEEEGRRTAQTPLATGVVYRDATTALFPELRQLRPGLRSLLVIHQNPTELSLVTKQVEALLPGVSIVPWFRPTIPALRDSVSRLRSDAAVLYLSIHRDGDGRPWTPADFLEAFQGASAQPVFGTYRNLLGHGILGGPLIDPARIGEAMARQTLAVLRDPEIARRHTVDTLGGWPSIYSWRELVRFGIDPRQLPRGARILGRPTPVWEDYPRTFWAVTLLVLVLTAAIVGLLVNRRNLSHAKVRMSGLTRRLQQTQELEQARLARELHDTLAQDLISQSLDLQLHAPHAAAPNQPTFVERLRRSVERVEAITHELHPSAMKLLDLKAGVQQLVNDLRARSAVEVTLHEQGLDRPIPEPIRAAVFRICQESFANIRRHAQATQVMVTIDVVQTAIELTIRDDGIGFDPDAPSDARLGLLGMRERAAVVGGRFFISSARNEGTTTTLTVPLAEA
jgi:signal transduction histidine kinase